MFFIEFFIAIIKGLGLNFIEIKSILYYRVLNRIFSTTIMRHPKILIVIKIF